MRILLGAGIVCGLVLWIGGAGALAAAPPDSKDLREPYRFQLKADGGGKIAFRGLITVDGKDRVIAKGETPFEFRCEAGSVIAGYFEPIDPGRTLRLKVFDPAHSKRSPALTSWRFPRIRFSWAQPGVGPHCVDQGEGACPEATPSADAFREKLDALLRLGAREPDKNGGKSGAERP